MMHVVEPLVRDLADALRSMRQRPGFTALAVLTLALGIGVNGAAIATAYGILVRPLPYESPDRIVVVNLLFPDGGDLGFSPSRVDEWLRRLSGVDAAAAYYTRDVTVRSRSHSTLVHAAFVTEQFFTVFGARPQSGQARVPAESATVVVGRNRLDHILGSDTAIAIGASLSVADAPRTVAAVLPADFAFPDEQAGIWLPARVPPLERGYSKIVARLRPGVTLAQFRADVERVARDMKSDPHNRIVVAPLGDSIVGRVRAVLIAAVCGSLLVLVVACANVATLFIGRDLGRRREFATRLALGATRVDLVRGALTEALLFAMVAAVAGLTLAQATLTWLAREAAAALPRQIPARLDPAAALTITGLVLAAALLSGVVPAWHAAHGDFSGFLRPTSSSRPGSWTARRLLVIAQICCCCMLLIGAGLLTRTVTVLLHEDAGFNPHDAIVAKLVLSDVVLAPSVQAPFVGALLERARALPEVHDAGLGSNLPPRTPPVTMSIEVERDGRRESRLVKVGSMTPGFLPALGARFVAGRDFADADARTPVVVVSESLARMYFGDHDPIGRTFASLPPMFGLAGAPRVVGVVTDVKYDGLDSPAGGAIYLPWYSRPFGTAYLVVRTASDPRRVLADLRRTIAGLDGGVPVPELLPLDDILAQSVAARRMQAIPAAAFAMLALAVAAVGIMATLSTLVAERRRDIAIRSALGASRKRLLWAVGSQGLALTAVGVMAGLGGGALAARGLSSLLYGIRPYDPVTFAGTAVIVTAISLLMTAVSAVRTLRIDPIAVLRQDA